MGLKLFVFAGILYGALAMSAQAADVEGTVIKNGGSCAVDGICALDVKTSGGSTARFIWGWEAPISGCDPDEEAIRTASKLAPGQAVKVTAPDQFAQVTDDGVKIYYLCQGASVRAPKQ